jgi:hypothetical protein
MACKQLACDLNQPFFLGRNFAKQRNEKVINIGSFGKKLRKNRQISIFGFQCVAKV